MRRRFVSALMVCFMIILSSNLSVFATVNSVDINEDINVNNEEVNRQRFGVKLCSMTDYDIVNKYKEIYKNSTPEQRKKIVQELTNEKSELLNKYKNANDGDRVLIVNKLELVKVKFKALYSYMTDAEKQQYKQHYSFEHKDGNNQLKMQLEKLTDEQIIKLKAELESLKNEYKPKFENATTEQEKQKIREEFVQKVKALQEKYGITMDMPTKPQQKNQENN